MKAPSPLTPAPGQMRRPVEPVTGTPLTASINNLVAYKLGDVCINASRALCGDRIDTGLILRRMLEEVGFYLLEMPSNG